MGRISHYMAMFLIVFCYFSSYVSQASEINEEDYLELKVYREDFNDFAFWPDRWFGKYTDAENYYVVYDGKDPTFRGNNWNGMWLAQGSINISPDFGRYIRTIYLEFWTGYVGGVKLYNTKGELEGVGYYGSTYAAGGWGWTYSGPFGQWYLSLGGLDGLVRIEFFLKEGVWTNPSSVVGFLSLNKIVVNADVEDDLGNHWTPDTLAVPAPVGGAGLVPLILLGVLLRWSRLKLA